jgi:hypothetical protein
MLTYFRLLASAALIRTKTRPARDAVALVTFTKN